MVFVKVVERDVHVLGKRFRRFFFFFSVLTILIMFYVLFTVLKSRYSKYNLECMLRITIFPRAK